MFGPFAFHSSQTCTLIISLLSMFGFVSFDISFSISCSRPSLLTCRLLKHVCLSACSRSCCCNVRPSTAPSPPSLCSFITFIISSSSSAQQSQQSHQQQPPAVSELHGGIYHADAQGRRPSITKSSSLSAKDFLSRLYHTSSLTINFIFI